MFLQSDTLRLRAPEFTDLDFLFHIENDTRLWVVSACKTPYSRYQLQTYIENNAHDLYADKQMRLMIEADGTVAGTIDLFEFSPADRRAEVGIVIDKDFRRRGLGKEALTLMCDYASRMLSMHQLYAYVLADNVAARQLFTSCGFREVVCLADWVLSGNEYRAVCLYQRIFEK